MPGYTNEGRMSLCLGMAILHGSVALGKVFEGWKRHTQQHRRLRTWAGWGNDMRFPGRCLLCHFYDTQGSFASHLMRLHAAIGLFIDSQALTDMTEIITTAVREMNAARIKELSHSGAVHLGRGTYVDRGNFVYSIWWVILENVIVYRLRSGTTARDDARRYRAFQNMQRAVGARWNRDPDSTTWCEKIGDMIEITFASAYMDQERFSSIQPRMGPPINIIAEIVKHLDTYARYERLQEHGSFFSQRGACNAFTTKLSNAIFAGMQVHVGRIDVFCYEGREWLELSRRFELFYEPLHG